MILNVSDSKLNEYNSNCWLFMEVFKGYGLVD